MQFPHIMAAHVPEKLVPFIRAVRKLKACDSQQHLNILQQVPQIFNIFPSIPNSTEIIFARICHPDFYEKISTALYHDIESNLPSDDELVLRDTVYESRLVQTPENQQGEQSSTDERQRTLPLTMLRIPSDVQFHIFHFLDYKHLAIVQKSCRALCIAARNPLSLHTMLISSESHPKMFSEWLSRPTTLIIKPRWHVLAPLTGNAKWGQYVRELLIDPDNKYLNWMGSWNLQNLGHFDNLTRCEIRNFAHILLNGQISSYFSLKELVLTEMDLTEQMIEKIWNFRNLERLSVECGDYGSSGIRNRSDPIFLPRLSEFKIKINGGDEVPDVFQRVLIGSQPRNVNVEVNYSFRFSESVLVQTDAALKAMRAIRYLKIKGFCLRFITLLCPWLRRAQINDRQIFDECKISVYFDKSNILLPPIITLFGCANKSSVQLKHCRNHMSEYNMDHIIQRICDAPFDTFNEIMVDINCDICNSENDDGWFGVRVLNLMSTKECSENDHETVQGLVMKRIDEAEEQLMKPWLAFNEEKMQQIGLQKLEIKFECVLELEHVSEMFWGGGSDDWNDEKDEKPNRFDSVLSQRGDEWMHQRVTRWSTIDQRCSTVVEIDQEVNERRYRVILSLIASEIAHQTQI